VLEYFFFGKFSYLFPLSVFTLETLTSKMAVQSTCRVKVKQSRITKGESQAPLEFCLYTQLQNL